MYLSQAPEIDVVGVHVPRRRSTTSLDFGQPKLFTHSFRILALALSYYACGPSVPEVRGRRPSDVPLEYVCTIPVQFHPRPTHELSIEAGNDRAADKLDCRQDWVFPRHSTIGSRKGAAKSCLSSVFRIPWSQFSQRLQNLDLFYAATPAVG